VIADPSRPSSDPTPSDPTRQNDGVGIDGSRADGVVVRAAIEDDLDVLVEHTWAVAAEGGWLGIEVPFDRDARRLRFAGWTSGESSTVLVADSAPAGGPGIVGYISIEIARYGVADIGMLIIDGWRGRGLGTLLLSAAIDWATANRAHKVGLEVWPHNSAAIALYRRAGFAEEGRRRRHYRRGNGEIWDSVIMGRQLPS
jgi:RimJ/RimL family protein N-acetyltransferase